jgi:hypothetical protein
MSLESKAICTTCFLSKMALVISPLVLVGDATANCKKGERREEPEPNDSDWEKLLEIGGDEIMEDISAMGIEAAVPLLKRIW